MSKKLFVVILVLSIIATYGIAFLDFTFNISKGTIGLPFGFSRFNFLGAETNYAMFTLDIVFWFVIILGIWKVIPKPRKK